MKAAICLFSFSNFTFGSNAFHLKKLKIIQYDFYNRVLMSLIYRSDGSVTLGNLMFLKLACVYCPRRFVCFKKMQFPRGNYLNNGVFPSRNCQLIVAPERKENRG